MRLSSRERRAARQPRRLAASLMALSALAPSLTQAISFNPVPSANLDLSNLGRVAIAGDFNGISLYEFEGQIGKPLSTNGSESLLAQLPNAALASVVASDASIRAMCGFKLENNGAEGVVMGGNFTSLGGIKSTALAFFNPNTTKVTNMDGLEGEINTILCDQDSNTLYIGGNFKAANSTNAIAWVSGDGWKNLPFAGFNGPVEAITKASNGHIIFGGSFTGLGNASTPSQPDGQTINLSTANITASNSVSTAGFKDPKNIVCSDGADGPGKTWLAEDNTATFWEAKFGFGFVPTKLRLWNTHQDGRGTKTWRYQYPAQPVDGIANFTYVDPVTKQNATCTSECPLSNDPKIKFQDFHFVNPVGMDRLRISVSEWYGNGAGLAGIELFQDNIFAYAISDFNEPACGGAEFPSTASSTGPWAVSPSLQSNSQYLTATLNGDKINSKSASVVFVPNIRESGNYSVNVYTPGCVPDNTCDTRGRVNVTGIMSTGNINADFTTSLFQTNNFDKYDQVYFGYIEKNSAGFKPTVTITPLDGQDIDKLTIVAQRVGFSLINSTGGLNGLFDFDPKKTSFDATDLDSSAINKLGASFNDKSAVKTLATASDTVFVGGNFSSPDHQNVVAINTDKTIKTLDGGLNGEVFSMHLEGTQLYVGGAFTNSLSKPNDGLSHVAVYDTSANTWNTLGAGVDGDVEFVVPFQVSIHGKNVTAIALTGYFTECKKFGDSPSLSVDGFAIWVPSNKTWLQNIDAPIPSYSGILTASVLGLSDGLALYAGSMTSAQLGADGAATLDKHGLGSLPIKASSQPSTPKVSRRDLAHPESISGVVTGAFYDNNNSNITVLAGRFSAQGENGTTINNLMFMDGNNHDAISGVGSDVSAESAFVTVAIRDTILYAGGKVTGKINGNDITGLVAYDLGKKSFSNQPPSVSGGNATVSTITVQPDTANIYVGGSFNRAGALDCPGLCVFNVEAGQWSRPGSGTGGNVTAIMWSTKTTLIAAGDLTANGTDKSFMLTYDAKKQTWANFPSAKSIPGPVQAMTPASGSGNEVWISGTSSSDGSTYLMKYDGKKWHTVNQTLAPETVIESLQVFSLTKSHDKSDTLGDKQALMLTGSIGIPDVGTVSAALYNGTHYRPYALTTSSGGRTGTIARMFSQKGNYFSSGRHHMPLVFVVLIGLAISLGLILLLVLGGIILDRLRKKREGYAPAPTSMYDRGSGIQRIPPRELLESLGRSRPGAAPHV